MKNQWILGLASVMALSSCQRLAPTDRLDVSGYLIEDCVNQRPIVGATLVWGGGGYSDAITCETDSNGFFSMTGVNKIRIGVTSENASKLKIRSDGNTGYYAHKELTNIIGEEGNIGNLYFDGTVNVSLTIQGRHLDTTSLSDTLYVQVWSEHPQANGIQDPPGSDQWLFKYAGPFTAEDILDTYVRVKQQYGHVGLTYGQYLYGMKYSYSPFSDPNETSKLFMSPFVDGQENNVCDTVYPVVAEWE